MVKEPGKCLISYNAPQKLPKVGGDRKICSHICSFINISLLSDHFVEKIIKINVELCNEKEMGLEVKKNKQTHKKARWDCKLVPPSWRPVWQYV